MKKLSADEIERWITLDNGVHVPIKKGETEADAIKRLGTFLDTTISNDISTDYKHTKMVSGGQLDKLPKKVIQATTSTIAQLNANFPKIAKFIDESNCALTVTTDSNLVNDITPMATQSGLDWKHNTLKVDNLFLNANNNSLSSLKSMKTSVKDSCTKGFYMPCAPDNYQSYLIAHEYGHIVQTYLMRDRHDWKNLAKTSKSKSQPEKYQEAIKDTYKEMYKELVKVGKKSGYITDYEKSVDNVSLYALSKAGQGDLSEVFAESFANMVCGSPNEWGKTMEAYLKEKGVLK